MIGSDKVGSFGAAYEKEITKYEPLLRVLKPETARNLAHPGESAEEELRLGSGPRSGTDALR